MTTQEVPKADSNSDKKVSGNSAPSRNRRSKKIENFRPAEWEVYEFTVRVKVASPTDRTFESTALALCRSLHHVMGGKRVEVLTNGQPIIYNASGPAGGTVELP